MIYAFLKLRERYFVNFLFCESFAKFGCVLWINLVVCYVEIANTVVLMESVLCLFCASLTS